ncbi:MAG: hypothetical protein IJT39_07450 [Bacteroidales bacterium]|nr:hypothetical protein [Bacteroidales bacterium]
MKNKIQALLLISVAASVMVSCQKDDISAIRTFHAVIADTYTSGNGNAKVVIDATTLKPSFVSGDSVWINGVKYYASVSGGSVSLSGEDVANPFFAAYPFNIVNNAISGGVAVSLPSEQDYSETDGHQVINAPMAAYSENEGLQFKNVCALIKVRVRNNMGKGDFTLSSITVTASDAKLSGPATITGTGSFTLTVDNENAASSNSVTLTGLTETVKENKSSKDYYIFIPPVTDEKFTIVVTGRFEGVKYHGIYTQVQSSDAVTINTNYIAPISHILNQCAEKYYPYGGISGMFSVSATQKVYFSSGNLQWGYDGGATHATQDGEDNGAGTWRFAENQWESYSSGNTEADATARTSGHWTDLFGWGTSGWNNGNTYYYPWNRSTTSNYGPIKKSTQYSLTGDYDNSDWGVYNAISNGGNSVGRWRTLTRTEWEYMLSTRSNASSLQTAATVNGVQGYVILPDDWTTPSDVSLTTGATNVTSNVLSATQWAILEANGAVFLPETGWRSGTVMKDVANHVCPYWTSSLNTSYTSCAYRFYFKTGSKATIGSTSTTYKYYGYAVRLVCDAN